MLDLSKAVVVSAENARGVEAKAVTVLVEEVEKRTGIRLANVHGQPPKSVPSIVVGSEASLGPLAGPVQSLNRPRKEGYRIFTAAGQHPVAYVVGSDPRGVLYGVGKLLRRMHLSKGSIAVDERLSISSTPRYALRGHQLGYRPKTNAYDAWSPEQFDQYIRELALFGVNSIEILPPRTDDEPTSPLMRVAPFDMMVKLSEIIDSYGLDVWVWYPNVGSNYTAPECAAQELAEREQVFGALPRLDAVFVPGGDPGDLPPDALFKWAGKVAEVLHRCHPKALIWLSPQAMAPTERWLDAFYSNVKQGPPWLGGIVFGPWVKTPLPQLRDIIPREYPIRFYPDITHSLQCQYPVPDWDPAFAVTLGRECINPRPRAMKHIHNLYAPYTIGSITYSEGINDDVNKFVWSDQDWDPHTPVVETLREYAGLFIGGEYTEGIAQGLCALEENWRGPLAVNQGVDVTLRQWQEMERKAPADVLDNYRFQMGLLRAYYDAYVRRRLIYETELEQKALDALRRAPEWGSLRAVSEAERILEKARTEPVAQDYRKRCEELADALFRNIGAQLSVHKHMAIHWSRGAFMDDIDMPLNNARFLLAQLRATAEMDSEEDRQQAIHTLINRANPGPGGFYDDLGLGKTWHRVVKLVSWEEDPGSLSSPLVSFTPSLLHPEGRPEFVEGTNGIPLSWAVHVTALYDVPLVAVYEDLDPHASYTLRVTYVPPTDGKVRLLANDRYLVHDFLDLTGELPAVKEFPVPREAVSTGRLTLSWTRSGGRRTCVAELLLAKNGERRVS
ncbi:MAG: hypothetical protein ACUVRO_06490 [Armatimonadota bacterium]